MRNFSSIVLMLCLFLVCLPQCIYAEEIDYKNKSDEQLLQMCYQMNDSGACFVIAGRLKDADQGRDRISVLEYGASVPGKKNYLSLLCMTFLAKSYIEGDGVPQDYVKGYKWANILASLSEKIPIQGVAKYWRDKLIKVMTQEQISEAQKESRIWFDQHTDW